MHTNGIWAVVLGLGTTLLGCSDQQYNPGGPAIDPNAPSIHITAPARGTFAGNVTTVTVTGTATDDTAVAGVTVNGVAATLAADGTFTASVPVIAGTNLLHAIATDSQGNEGKETRAVVAGPMEPIDQPVIDAITASVSAQTFDAIGRGASTYVQTADLQALVAPHNPVVDVGGGPDCLYGQAFVTSMTVGGAHITLPPVSGGLNVDAELDNVKIGMHLQYAVACLDDTSDITVSVSHLSVKGVMSIGVAGGKFDFHLDNPDVTLTGFDMELPGVPGEIVDLLDLNDAIGPMLGWAVSTFISPMVASSLDNLNNATTIDVLGTAVDVNVSPAKIDFETTGAIVELDTSIRAHGDTSSPGFVFVSNLAPAMDPTQGFQLAIADATANQMLGSFWAAKGLDQTLDLTTGNYGEIGQLYDHVEISAAVPPYVDASGGSLKLTIGDLMATFKSGSAVTTQIAVNAEVEVKVTAGADGALKLDVGSPTVYVDVLDDGVEGANALSSSNFEAIASFASERIISYGSGAIGAVPLPTLGGVAMQNVSVSEQTGYLVVDGDVQ